MRLPIFKALLFCLMLLFWLPVFSATTPVDSINTIPAADIHKKITSLKVRDIQKLTGKKMTLKQKISFGVLKHKLKKESRSSKQGQTALIFAIIRGSTFDRRSLCPLCYPGGADCCDRRSCSGIERQKKES